ncbi:Holliday junction resolvase RuvX [Candidatus Desulfovibrio trichonymphae]|uniref:Putative pre-16S rRNA nuclease n=1 Tax=Candidatus Desulfovibrio trichonymphae TaxID=1725232 RepID=A0A1J1DP18_9BACT|nr:Holliday junction resolvase RuvX [Candidatus Desulfovibrio trichonymphae]BAV91578.1 putative Holliday junction resolvase YqgF [Candidatus Desulfovibrio trichonymphae]GHU89514.1 putative pre-16S rRNA nuclease [Deltaproteobacteria bacterium]
MKYVGVDYGLARTGLAVSDPEGRLAFPLATLRLQDFLNRKALLAELAARVAHEGAGTVVVGLPVHEDGRESLITRQVRNVTERLKRRVYLPFFFMAETLSSVEALDDLREAGIASKRRRDVIDQQAAVRILASFLALNPDERRRA